nr:hypothetical protein [Tanacetum cinerariifolium]
KGPTWLFDIDYLTDSINYQPITAENKANKTVGPKETNNSAGAVRANSTNYVNTTRTTVNASSTPLNTASTPTNQDDSQIPSLEDIYEVSKDRIFTSAPYDDDEGVVADFTNLETTVNKKAIWTKWVYRNKMDEKGVVVINKARLAARDIDKRKGWTMMRRGLINKTLFIKKDKKDIMRKEDGIFISQDKYAADILKKFDLLSVKTASTLIETKKPLVKDEEAANVDVHLYRSMISSLMYLTASRPDIMYAICACFRFQVTPKTSHLQALKRIFRYLKDQPKLGLWYPRESTFNLEAYSDSDYAGANLDRKSTTGGC